MRRKAPSRNVAYLILAHDLGYGDTDQLTALIEDVSKMLNAYADAILSSGS